MRLVVTNLMYAYCESKLDIFWIAMRGKPIKKNTDVTIHADTSNPETIPTNGRKYYFLKWYLLVTIHKSLFIQQLQGHWWIF